MKQMCKTLSFVLALAMIVSMFTVFATDALAANRDSDYLEWDFSIASGTSSTSWNTGTSKFNFDHTNANDGVWQLTGQALKISWQANAFHPTEPGWKNLHYAAKVVAGGTYYNTAYTWMMLEYRATTTSTNARLFVHENGGLKEVNFGAVTTGKWTFTDPVSMPSQVVNRINNKAAITIFSDDTDQNATYEIARVLFFKDNATAEAYKVAGENPKSWNFADASSYVLEAKTKAVSGVNYTIYDATSVIENTQNGYLTLKYAPDALTYNSAAGGDNAFQVPYQAKVAFPSALSSKAYRWAVVDYYVGKLNDSGTVKLQMVNDYLSSIKKEFATISSADGTWKHSSVVDIHTGHGDRRSFVHRLAFPQHISLQFTAMEQGNDLRIAEVRFFASKAQATEYANSAFPAATSLNLYISDIDYLTKTVTLAAKPTPATAPVTGLTYSIASGTPESTKVNADGTFSVTLKNLADVVNVKATLGAVSDEAEIKDLTDALNDKIVMDFADPATVEFYTTETVGQNGDGNDGTINRNGGYAGYGVWEYDGSTVKIGYQKILQETGNSDPLGKNGIFGHYMTKIRFPLDVKYDKTYAYMMVEYKAKNASASGVNLNLFSDGTWVTGSTWTNIDTTDGWHMTDPVEVHADVAKRLSSVNTNLTPNVNLHCTLWFSETKTDAEFEVARILYFKTLADAQRYKDTVAALTYVERIQNATTDPAYSNTGESATLEVFVRPVTTDPKMTWEILEGSDIATLNGAEITFSRAGTATVRGTTADGKTIVFDVKAAAEPKPGVSISATDSSVNIGETVDFGLVPYDVDLSSVVWTLSDANGAVLATKEGSHVFSYNFVKAGTYTVTAAAKGTIENYTMPFEDTVSMTVTVTDDTAMNGWMITQAMHQHLTSNTKTVIFRDADGKVISEQKVVYGNAAKAPKVNVDFTVPLDKVWLGWDNNGYTRVTEDIDTKVVLVDAESFNVDTYVKTQEEARKPVVEEVVAPAVDPQVAEVLKSAVVWDLSSKFNMEQSGAEVYVHHVESVSGKQKFDTAEKSMSILYGGSDPDWGTYRVMLRQKKGFNNLTAKHTWVILVYKADSSSKYSILIENNSSGKENVLVKDASVSNGLYVVSKPVQIEESYLTRMMTFRDDSDSFAHVTFSMETGSRSNATLALKAIIFCESEAQATLYASELNDTYKAKVGVSEILRYE